MDRGPRQNFPCLTAAYEAAASLALRKRDNRPALEHIEKGLKATKGSAVLHYLRGYVAFSSGDVLEAEAAFQRALELQPDHLDSLANLGEICLANGSYRQALHYFLRPYQADPNDPGLYLSLANAVRRTYKIDTPEQESRTTIWRACAL